MKTFEEILTEVSEKDGSKPMEEKVRIAKAIYNNQRTKFKAR